MSTLVFHWFQQLKQLVSHYLHNRVSYRGSTEISPHPEIYDVAVASTGIQHNNKVQHNYRLNKLGISPFPVGIGIQFIIKVVKMWSGGTLIGGRNFEDKLRSTKNKTKGV